MTTQNNPRRVAAAILDRWLREGAFPDRMIEGTRTPDRAFLMEVVYGVVRRRRVLDWVIDEFAERKPGPRVYPFLLVGLYQVLIMDDVVDYAAVHETVAVAKASGCERTAGFLNALLRRAVRERTELQARIETLPLAIRESHPDRLVERWTARYGGARAEALCRWNNSRPRITIHPNRLRTTVEAYRDLLRTAGLHAEPHPFAPSDFLVLPRGTGVRELPGYRDGLFSVRDPSTQVALDLLAPRPGETILDGCAAPGGKLCGIAERMEDRGRVLAMDLHEDRLAILRENLARLRIQCAQVLRGDASDPAALRDQVAGEVDRVLLDVPCTNTGVLRRRPDARWRISERKINKMAGTQRKMLDAVSGLLRCGGRLVYSTCSLEPEEGEALIRTWLAAHPSYTLDRQVALFPPQTETDGIYAASLLRRA